MISDEYKAAIAAYRNALAEDNSTEASCTRLALEALIARDTGKLARVRSLVEQWEKTPFVEEGPVKMVVKLMCMDLRKILDE